MEYGCIGKKLGHSFSKIIHNELADYDYELLEIDEEDIDAFMKKADFKAINVTIPYKQTVIPYLYYIDDIAKKIGAVNTIVNKNGKLYGYNTDFSGLTDLINHNKIEIAEKKVLVLGSGGTSKTATEVAKSLCAKEVLRVSRSKNANTVTYEEVYKYHSDADVIINTTPVGMYPNIGQSAIDISGLKNLAAVVDAVYNPLCSNIVIEARKRGIIAVGGLYMLVSQAVRAAEKFLDVRFESNITDKIYTKIFKQKQNIVLIGMPSSGKTTLGKLTAQQLGKNFIDTDDEIVKKIGMPISDFFKKYGEQKFREEESKVIAEVSKVSGLVIATGGGAILNNRNIDLLRENGLLIFIDRPLSDLITTNDRPLSSNKDDLIKRYNERYDIYKSVADAKIDAVSDIDTNTSKIKEVFLNENFSN